MTDEEKRAAGLVKLTIWLPKEAKEEFAKFAAELAKKHTNDRINLSEKQI